MEKSGCVQNTSTPNPYPILRALLARLPWHVET